MKIIFLDIDGVLNSRAYDRTRNRKAQTGIDETRLPLLKKIVEKTGAKIVLSSTWRADWEKDPALCRDDGVYINKTFAKFGLCVYDKTPDFWINGDRPDEIRAWLCAAKDAVESFVIIDDYPYDWAELAACFVKTKPKNGLGLEEEHVAEAVAILNRRGEQGAFKNQ